jgi:hypothetical protein
MNGKGLAARGLGAAAACPSALRPQGFPGGLQDAEVAGVVDRSDEVGAGQVGPRRPGDDQVLAR